METRKFNPLIFNMHTGKLEEYTVSKKNNIFPSYYMSRAHIEWSPSNTLYSEISSEKNMNAGDLYTEFIINNLSKEFYYKFTINGPESVNGILCKERYLICGSLLQDSMPNSILCGVGIIRNNIEKRQFKKCLGVRGFLSLEKVKDWNPDYDYSNICMGDPGLTLSYFFPNETVQKKYKYGIILHFGDVGLLNKYFDEDFLNVNKVINIRTADFNTLSKNICECENIISSSLHGIIFAHSYNIPTIWVELETSQLCNKNSDNIKFYDHLSIFENNFKYDLKNRYAKTNINNYINYQINNSNIINLNKYTPTTHEVTNIKNNILNMLNKIIDEYKNTSKDTI